MHVAGIATGPGDRIVKSRAHACEARGSLLGADPIDLLRCHEGSFRRSMWHDTDMATVEMYTTLTCGSCIRAKRLLAAKGVEVTEIDVSFDRMEMMKRADGRSTVPQIFIDDEGIGGFDDLVELERLGRLDAMLGLVG
ncbi:MAG: grxC [Thermoleophilia bacterium]|nr:grxC [Thermoleophilia bacterium]